MFSLRVFKFSLLICSRVYLQFIKFAIRQGEKGAFVYAFAQPIRSCSLSSPIFLQASGRLYVQAMTPFRQNDISSCVRLPPIFFSGGYIFFPSLFFFFFFFLPFLMIDYEGGHSSESFRNYGGGIKFFLIFLWIYLVLK